MASDGVRLSVWLRQSDILDGLEDTSRSTSSGGATNNYVLVITPDNYEVAVQAARAPRARTPSLADLHGTFATDVRLCRAQLIARTCLRLMSASTPS